ncbi:hypothetical protein V8D89_011917 [Ganoderma adspersum]
MIFLEACTDGGGTGCSLSLVSRDVYRVSRAARFHSVSLLTPSLWKLRRFLEEYTKARDAAIQEAPRGTVPRIRHLCLLVDLPDFFHCDRLDVQPAQWDPQYPERLLYRRFRKHLLDNLWGRTQDLPSKELTRIIDVMGRRYRDSAVVTLLEQVSGDLYSLCLYQFPRLRGTRDQPKPPPLCIRVPSFPNLRELWLGGKDECCAPLFLQGTSFPALKRLHMCATSDTDVLHWLSAAPLLDCLRIFADPRLLTREKGRQTFMEITAHPIWREQGKQLTIVVPLERNKSLGWWQFGQCAYDVRRELAADAAAPLVFVPCYVGQDVDWRVHKAFDGRRRFPLLHVWSRRKPITTQDELIRRDWLARADGRWNGIYVETFWAHFVGDGKDERKRIKRSHCLYSLDGTAYVAPLIIQRKAV